MKPQKNGCTATDLPSQKQSKYAEQDRQNTAGEAWANSQVTFF